jgi:hypothetical protein
MIGERISQYILKSKTNRKIKAARPPRQKRIEAMSQMLGMMFLIFCLTRCPEDEKDPDGR